MRLLVLIFLTSQLLFAQSANELLKKAQSKFDSITDFSANFVQSDCKSLNKSLKGKILYKKKNKFVVEFKNQKIISNGNTLWNYNQIQKQVIISNFTDEPTIFSIERFIYNYPQFCNIKLFMKGSDNDVIELVPKDRMLDFKNLKIWKDKNDLIQKIELLDLDDNCFIFELSEYIINQNLADTIFTFNPPKGIRIIDLR